MIAMKKKNANPLFRRIARSLEVSETGLKLLMRAVALPDGRASGEGFGHGSGGARAKLLAQGYVGERNLDCDPALGEPYTAYITDAGREIVRRAREMGA